MIVKKCNKCGVVSVVYTTGKMPWTMFGSFCGCPYWVGKHKRIVVSDGVLVIMEEVGI